MFERDCSKINRPEYRDTLTRTLKLFFLQPDRPQPQILTYNSLNNFLLNRKKQRDFFLTRKRSLCLLNIENGNFFFYERSNFFTRAEMCIKASFRLQEIKLITFGFQRFNTRNYTKGKAVTFIFPTIDTLLIVDKVWQCLMTLSTKKCSEMPTRLRSSCLLINFVR